MKSAAHHQIKLLGKQGLNGAVHGIRFVLAIAVHHYHHIARGIKDALFDRTGEAVAAHSADQPDAGMLLGQFNNGIGGAIGRVIVNEENFKLLMKFMKG